jgi:hypothetical protein
MGRLVELDDGQLLGTRVADPAPDLRRCQRPVPLPRLVDVQLRVRAFGGARFGELGHEFRLVVQMWFRLRRRFIADLGLERGVVRPLAFRCRCSRGRSRIRFGRGDRDDDPALGLAVPEQRGEDPKRELGRFDADPDAEAGGSDT